MGKNAHIDLFTDMIPAIDLNIKELWDASTDEGRKEIIGDLWILPRYISTVKTKNREVQEHYVLTVNEYYNKHWDVIHSHPQLLWMLLCACSYDQKTKFYHQWIGHTRTTKSNTKMAFLEEVYPNKKLDELVLMAAMMDDSDFKLLAKDTGLSDKEITKKFKPSK